MGLPGRGPDSRVPQPDGAALKGDIAVLIQRRNWVGGYEDKKKEDDRSTQGEFVDCAKWRSTPL